MDPVIIVEVLFVGGVALSFGFFELWSLRRLERRRREAERALEEASRSTSTLAAPSTSPRTDSPGGPSV